MSHGTHPKARSGRHVFVCGSRGYSSVFLPKDNLCREKTMFSISSLEKVMFHPGAYKLLVFCFSRLKREWRTDSKNAQQFGNRNGLGNSREGPSQVGVVHRFVYLSKQTRTKPTSNSNSAAKGMRGSIKSYLFCEKRFVSVHHTSRQPSRVIFWVRCNLRPSHGSRQTNLLAGFVDCFGICKPGQRHEIGV